MGEGAAAAKGGQAGECSKGGKHVSKFGKVRAARHQPSLLAQSPSDLPTQ